MAEYEALTHTFDPVYNADSQILILGTFPSVKSRQQHFYYGHPQNRFWKVLAAVTGEQLPVSIEEKKDLLFRNHIAVWDVIHSCSIIGSSDSSIKDVVPNDIAGLLKKTKIRIIAGNGNKACELYQKYCQMQTGCVIMRLPSTSPANAADDTTSFQSTAATTAAAPIVAIAVCAIVLTARMPAAFAHFVVLTLGFNTQFFNILLSFLWLRRQSHQCII